MKGLWGKNTLIETLLEKGKAIYALQTWRKRMMTQSNKTDSTYGKLFEIERGLRNLAQIERVILDTASDTHKDENSSDTELSTFLNEIRQEYYVRDSMWWYIRMQLPADSAARGFDLWRSHPR